MEDERLAIKQREYEKQLKMEEERRKNLESSNKELEMKRQEELEKQERLKKELAQKELEQKEKERLELEKRKQLEEEQKKGAHAKSERVGAHSKNTGSHTGGYRTSDMSSEGSKDRSPEPIQVKPNQVNTKRWKEAQPELQRKIDNFGENKYDGNKCIIKSV